MRRPRSGGAVARTLSPANSPATAIHDPSRIDILRAVARGDLPMLTAWHSHAGHVVDDDGLPRPSARSDGSSL